MDLMGKGRKWWSKMTQMKFLQKKERKEWVALKRTPEALVEVESSSFISLLYSETQQRM